MRETKTYKKGIAISAALLLIAGASFSAYLYNERKTESPHYVDLACSVCHAFIQGVCSSLDCESCHPKDNTEPYMQLKADELTLCTSCHGREGDLVVENSDGLPVNIDLGNSHPWGLVPSQSSTPKTLPLKGMGNVITCMTCHDVHLSNTESHMLRLYTPGGKEDDLQAADYTVLCLDCHDTY